MIIKENGTEITQKKSSFSKLKSKMTIQHPTCFVKKELYSKIGLFNDLYKIAGDYDFFLRAKMQGVNAVCLNDLIAYFRVGGASSNLRNRLLEKKKIHANHFSKLYSNYRYYASYWYYKTLKFIKNIKKF
jgi:glycosyltransferase